MHKCTDKHDAHVLAEYARAHTQRDEKEVVFVPACCFPLICTINKQMVENFAYFTTCANL